MTPTVMNVAFLTGISLLAQTAPASAYLDPGTGSMMLQAVLGGIVGAMVVGRAYWHRLRTSVTNRFSARRHDARAATDAKVPSEANAPKE